MGERVPVAAVADLARDHRLHELRDGELAAAVLEGRAARGSAAR